MRFFGSGGIGVVCSFSLVDIYVSAGSDEGIFDTAGTGDSILD